MGFRENLKDELKYQDIKVKEQIEKNKKYKRIKADLRVAGLELNKLKKAYKVYERQ